MNTVLWILLGVLAGFVALLIVGLIQKMRKGLKLKISFQEWTSRDWIALIFLLNLFINVGSVVYIGVNLPWNLLGKLGSFAIFGLIYSILLSSCLFCLALFVSEDEYLIKELKQLIAKNNNSSEHNN